MYQQGTIGTTKLVLNREVFCMESPLREVPLYNQVNMTLVDAGQKRNSGNVTKLCKYTSTCLEHVDGLKRTKDSLTPASVFITEVG